MTPTATALLSYVLDKAKSDPDVSEVYLHVQVGNDTAKDFYTSNGFEEQGIIKDYYKRIESPDCHLLSKSLKKDAAPATASEADATA
jgi:ribosomal protein S18 acetylase RimI-like enzyme